MTRLLIAIVLAHLAACGFANGATESAKPQATAKPPATKPKLPPAPPGVTILQDVTYLQPDRAEKLDLYLPTTRSSKTPAVVIIHGGGWVGGDKAAPREFNIGTTLALAGYVAASVNYKLAGDDRWPTNLFDCKNAVRFLRASADRYNIDSGHIGVIGGSAGGHLALMVAYTSNVPELAPPAPYANVSDNVDAVIDMYGITNLLTRQKTNPAGDPIELLKTTQLLPGTTRSHENLWRFASPVHHITEDSPPTLILQGRADTTVNREQSIELAEALKKAGVEHALILLDEIGHTFDLQTWNHKPLPRDLRPVVVEFFDKHLRRK